MKTVKSNQTFPAYKINDENDLDEFIANEIKEYDSIYKREGLFKVSCAGSKLFDVRLGEWLVPFSERNIKRYTDEEFDKGFSIVD